jgi:uncharacterized protein
MVASDHEPILRSVQHLVDASLTDTRVVLISGPRQSGKTTLVRHFVTAKRPYLTLDDAGTLAAALDDPTGFVRGLDGAVIDEIQRAPELMLALKVAVDADARPGRFLLTGVMALPAIGDSLAGRVAIVTLLPFAQSEIVGGRGDFIDRLFAGEPPEVTEPPEVGPGLVERVIRGGYPEAIARSTPRRRAAWFEDYVALILDRDVRDITVITQLDRLPCCFGCSPSRPGNWQTCPTLPVRCSCHVRPSPTMWRCSNGSFWRDLFRHGIRTARQG